MLVVIEKGQEEKVKAIFDKWDLHAAEIGVITEGPMVRYYMHGELVSEIPAESLVLGGGAPQYEREYKEPAYFAEAKKFNIDQVPVPDNCVAIAKQLVSLPNIASKRWVYEQYDSMVGTATMTTNRPSDAGVVNIKGTNKALVLTVDCNGRYVNADPEVGTMIAVSEAARNIVCAGGVPSAITNCLNFGNPYIPEVYWQFVGAIKGMGEACRRFETPVTGGNVSFYNQTVNEDGTTKPVFPTPTIGMLGVMEDKSYHMTLDFKYKGDLIYLLGEPTNDIASSEYLYNIVGVKNSPAPAFDIEKEFTLQAAIKTLIRKHLINAAHDVSDGGLWVALAEMAMPSQLGFDIETPLEFRKDAFLFGESQSRVVVTVSEDDKDAFLDFVAESNVPLMLLGHVTKGRMTIDQEEYGSVEEIASIYNNVIGNVMKKK